MMANAPSQTAMGSAVLRAAHVREDRPPWVLEDTVSELLLSKREHSTISQEISSWPPGVAAALRLSHVVRTRLAEDVAVEALEAGTTRYVLLGAGLDSFSLRHPRAREFDIVEVDHPVTQAWKRRRLASRGLGEPPNVRFVPVDLAEDQLDRLACQAPATWSWLGVTMYLDRPTIIDVLGRVAAGPHGTTLVVNFLVAQEALDRTDAVVRATSQRTVAGVGEPIRATFTRPQCEEALDRAGFASVELFDGESLAGRYLAGRPELQLPATTLIAVARV